MRESKYKNIKSYENYKKLLNSGMFFEFYPELTGDWDKDLEIINNEDKELDHIDKLCISMLSLSAFSERTGNLRPSEIKAMLEPFFGAERIDKCVDIMCGR